MAMTHLSLQLGLYTDKAFRTVQFCFSNMPSCEIQKLPCIYDCSRRLLEFYAFQLQSFQSRNLLGITFISEMPHKIYSVAA
jgi:hypothetical protein